MGLETFIQKGKGRFKRHLFILKDRATCGFRVWRHLFIQNVRGRIKGRVKVMVRLFLYI